MFNSVAFDVMIGMVAVYLLYSLLVTILGEMIASWLGIRARVLRRGIERMLNDGYVEQESPSLFKRYSERSREFLLREHKDFPRSFAGRFFDNPGIKYLAEKPKKYFSPAKPSYITKDMFSQTMIHLFRERGAGKTDIDKINYCLTYNTLHIQPQSLSFIRDLWDDAKNDPQRFDQSLQSWFEQTMDRVTGWYKRKNTLILFLIGFIIATILNVDSIKIAGILSKDKDARNQLVTMGTALARDTAKYREFVRANGDSVPPRAVLDSGFTRVTNDIAEANHVLGLGWDLDTMTVSCSLSRGDKLDPAAQSFFAVDSLRRRQCVAFEKNVILTSQIIDSYNMDKLRWDSVRAEFPYHKPPADKPFQPIQQHLSLDSVRVLMAMKRNAESLTKLKALRDSIARENETIRSFVPQQFLSIRSVKYHDNIFTIVGTVHRCFGAQIKLFLCESNPLRARFWGFLITALMLSLGAPFWFDLLQKFISLRSAGVKPETVKLTPATTSNVGALQGAVTTPALVSNAQVGSQQTSEDGVTQLKESLFQERDVVAVNSTRDDSGSTRSLEIIVKSRKALKRLSSTFGKILKNPPGKNVGLSYRVLKNAENKIHGGTISAGEGIGNRTRVNGVGTLGCFLGMGGSDKTYMLTCWHVIKDDTQWSASPVVKDVTDSEGLIIGTITDGHLYETIDIGIAECTDSLAGSNSTIKIKQQHREVTVSDSINQTKVFLNGQFCGPKECCIYYSETDAQLQYPDGNTYQMRDLFSITQIDPNDQTRRAPTSGGDSGAVVVDLETGEPLGMVIGGNQEFSYAIKFSNAFNADEVYGNYHFLLT